jgi:hypothetical protein
MLIHCHGQFPVCIRMPSPSTSTSIAQVPIPMAVAIELMISLLNGASESEQTQHSTTATGLIKCHRMIACMRWTIVDHWSRAPRLHPMVDNFPFPFFYFLLSTGNYVGQKLDVFPFLSSLLSDKLITANYVGQKLDVFLLLPHIK